MANRESIESFESALCDPALADIVELTARALDDHSYRVACVDGAVEFSRSPRAGSWDYEVSAVTGRNPLGDQATDRFVGHLLERSALHPERTQNAYPHAYESVAQFFDSPRAPDLLVTHTAAHRVEEHLGQHGSLGTVQARAPFLAAGAGIAELGTIDRSTRVVNIAPTIAALMGLEELPEAVGPTGEPIAGAFLRRQDGKPEREILDGTVAEHVVVFLLDGCNANLLADVIDSGEAPNMAGLLARGTMFGHGSMASLPTATLANHTTAITGAHPGHSGVLHNSWVDAASGEETDLLSIAEMFTAAQYLAPGVSTIFESVARSRPGVFSVATFEYCDRGADFSSFELVRSGKQNSLPGISSVEHLAPRARPLRRPLRVHLAGGPPEHRPRAGVLGRHPRQPRPGPHLVQPRDHRRGRTPEQPHGEAAARPCALRRPHRRRPRGRRRRRGDRADRFPRHRRPRHGAGAPRAGKDLGRRPGEPRDPYSEVGGGLLYLAD
ncbi:MAG: alkaline phosphatase family protein [Microthrixaceae bacterium]